MTSFLQLFGTDIYKTEYVSENAISTTQTIYINNAILTTNTNKLITIPWMRIDFINYTVKYKKDNHKITEKDTKLCFYQMRLPSMSDTNDFKRNDTYIITHINNIYTTFYAVINECNNIRGSTKKEHFAPDIIFQE